MKKTNLLARLSSAPIGAMLAILAGLSAILNLTLEILGRRSVSAAFLYTAGHPVMFIYNTLIILFTLSICLAVKKRLTMLFFLTVVWSGLGIANCILLGYRSSPLSAIDFTIVKSALGLFTLYLSVPQIVLIIIAVLLFVGLMVLLYIKCPKCRVQYRKSLGCIAMLGAVLLAANFLATKLNAVEYSSGELADTYNSYGFAYCFTRSLVSQGIKRPNDYSSDKLDALRESLAEDETTDAPETLPDAPDDETLSSEKPNIIFVQLESFFDLRRVDWLNTSAEVTPNFNKLKDSGVSGYLRMENVGGGTANSEFEVLTGMDLDHFGLGEYPYTTVLGSRACESIAYDLKAEGYGTHALHNHTATFYNRHIVYSNLGFDSFTPAEMMSELTYNPLGWERDEVLTDEIISALDSTGGSDFVFAVTVQGHGKYPEELPEADDSYPDYEMEYPREDFIRVSGCDDEKKLAQFTYYSNQLCETDDFIGELIEALDERGEPCVVVFYGDHLPALPLTDDEVDGTLFDTDWAVWTNTELFDEEREGKKDFEAYMLSSYILSVCDIDGGDITKLHQDELLSGENKNESLKLLEYSQLYDPDKPPSYEPTKMVFGTKKLSVTRCTRSGNTLFIYGSGFTENCEIEIGGFMIMTEYVSPGLLMVENVYFNDRINKVSWFAKDGTELASVKITQTAY